MEIFLELLVTLPLMSWQHWIRESHPVHNGVFMKIGNTFQQHDHVSLYLGNRERILSIS